MMLLIANTKGGVGKTSLATSMLSALAKQDKAVVGVDLDSANKSASEWWSKDRTVESGKFFFLSGEIREELARIKEDYDEVVVDAGGFDNIELRQAISLADVILIPLLVGSGANILGMQKVADVIEQIRPDNRPKVYAVAVRAPAMGTTPEYDRVVDEILNDPLAEPCPTNIVERSWYARAYDAGVGIMDLEPIKRSDKVWIDKAKAEFQILFNFIYGEK